MSVIKVNNLSKIFSQLEKPAGLRGFKKICAKKILTNINAVNGVSFDVNKGERVAFIGPNGAGKSTTLKMLSGILYPSDGDAMVAGFCPWENRRELAYKIGVVFGQRSQLWQHLLVRDSLEILARIYDIDIDTYKSHCDRLINIFHLEEFIDQPARSLSLGQRMRAEIVASLIHKPNILFLDEPTIGLDITSKAKLRDHLKNLSEEEGLTFLLTSHDTGDIEEICDRVILIDHGKKLIDTSLDNLKRQYITAKRVTLTTAEEAPEFELKGAKIIKNRPHEITLSVPQGKGLIEKLMTDAAHDLTLHDISIEDPPLEEVIKHIYEENKGAVI